MATTELYFNQIKELLNYEDHHQLVKRLIDLSLDTKEITYYKKASDLLDWLDEHSDKDVKEKLVAFFNELMAYFLSKQASPSKNNVLVKVNAMKRIYRNSAFTLGPISLEVKEGDIIGLVGENGNGKTTLLRCLCGELQITSGEVNYMFPYADLYDLRSQLIYIPQRTDVWRGSLLTNLQFTAASYGADPQENELIVQLIIARMGLRKYRDYKWRDLSSGYKMRFELARALLRNPRLLLIDEPLANLDILAQQVVLDDFKDMASSPFRPLGIILSSQQLYEVEKTSNSVIFLKDGAPRNMKDNTGEEDQEESYKLIIEFESSWALDELREAFESLGLEKLQINGGTYVASFPESVAFNQFLQLILAKKIPVVYYRDISKSTRRFFLS